MSKKKEYNIIIPVDLKPKPDECERTVAELMAAHYKSDIKFVKRGMMTTPDILVLRYNQNWEIKNIRGNSKRTIQNNLRRADDQSENVVICLFKTKMTAQQAVGRINAELSKANKIRKLILITKSHKIIVIKNK